MPDTEQEYTWYIYYHDEGPLGVCGQSVGITCPWDRLYQFIGTAREARNMALKMGERRSRKVTKVVLFAQSRRIGEDWGYPGMQTLTPRSEERGE